MARDFTDYVVEVHGAGDRVYYQNHFRQLKKDPIVTEFEFNGQTYLLNKDRAFRVKNYNVWKKWDRKRILWSLNELTRSKKVGLIKYREPAPSEPKMKEVETKVPRVYLCNFKDCAFSSDTVAGVKVHLSRRHKVKKKDQGKYIKVVFDAVKKMIPYFDPIEPYHISKMHQPSGNMPEDGKIVEEDPESLLNIITPRLLKVEIEDDTYKKAYKSFRFGNVLPMKDKWWIWIIIAIVGVFIILIATGNFSIKR